MGKIRREKTTKSKRKRVEEIINKEIRLSEGMNDKNRSLILGKILGQIQGKTIMKSMKNRKKAMMKKFRPPSEVHSQSVKTVMLATEQQQKNYKMLLEILSRLPVKSLLRFMCVSKQWNTLISSHPFRKLHREKHTSSPPLPIICYNTCQSHSEYRRDPMKTYLITFDSKGSFLERISVPLPLKYFVALAPSCQSKLLCFVSYELKKFYLCNPSTRQSFLLTNPSRLSSAELKEQCSAAYGYIPSKDEYIMAHLLKLSNGNLVCEVLENITISNNNFKLHYNQWRSSTEATIIFHFVRGPTAFVGGAFYWPVVATNPNEREEEGFILSFDVKADSLTTINYPPGVLSYAASLMDIKNDLYLMFYPESPPILVMWKWSSDNKLWSPHWKFDFRKLFEKVIGFSRGIPNPLGGYDFIPELFIYTLKYLKGYEDQPPDDDQALAEIGYLDLPPRVMVMGIPPSVVVAVHSNLFTL